MTARGTGVIFHSVLSFINTSLSVLLIWTASVICRSIASLRYDPVMDMLKDCMSPPCCARQCFHKDELLTLCEFRWFKCSTPRVYPFPAVSPLYCFLTQFSPRHFTAYVMLSVSQFPLPVVVQIKQSFRWQLAFLKGFDLCSSLFKVHPVHSTTLTRKPLFWMAWWYILFNFPSGVEGTNRTESNPPRLYQFLLFVSFSSTRSTLCQSLGL